MTFARLPFGPSVDIVSDCSSVVASKKGYMIAQYVARAADLYSFDGLADMSLGGSPDLLSNGCTMINNTREVRYAINSR